MEKEYEQMQLYLLTHDPFLLASLRRKRNTSGLRFPLDREPLQLLSNGWQ
jgi:hypothetical protein